MKKSFKLTIQLLPFLAVSNLLIAQTSDLQALNQIIKMGIDYSPKLKELEKMVEIADYKYKIQQSSSQPQIQSEISISRIDPVSKAVLGGGTEQITLQFQPNMNYNANINGNYVIYDWGKQAINLTKLGLDQSVAKLNKENLKLNFGYQIASIYQGIIFLKKSIEVQNEQLKLITENAKIIQSKLINGEVLEYDKISIDVKFKNAETRLIDLKSQLQKQYIYLNDLIGKEINSFIAENSNFSTDKISQKTDFDDYLKTNNIDLKILKMMEISAENDVKLSGLSRVPTLAATASVGLRNGYLPRINGDVPNITDDFKFGTNIGLKLSIPIYSGHRGAYQSEISKKNKEIISQKIETSQLTIKRDLALADNDLETAQQKYNLSENNVNQANYALKLAESRYKNGINTNLEVEIAQNSVLEAKLAQLQFHYQMALATLEKGRIKGDIFWE